MVRRASWAALVTVAALCSEVGRARAQCTEEDALSEAAAELMLAGERGAEAIAAALRVAGSDLPHARLAIFGDGEDPRAWLRQLEDDAPLVCGRAAAEGVVWILAAARGGALVPDGEGFRVRLAEGFRDARLAMRDARGELVRLPAIAGASVRPPPELVAPVQVQLVATGPSGPRPVAVRYVGGVPLGASAQGEGDLRARLRALRAAHGASELRDNRLLAREASHHAAQVCRAGRARHVLQATRDPEARLRGRGVHARVVGEVVARAATDDAAFEALMASPDHRMALVDRRFTDVGIGRGRHRGQACVVVTLAAWPRYVGR